MGSLFESKWNCLTVQAALSWAVFFFSAIEFVLFYGEKAGRGFFSCRLCGMRCPLKAPELDAASSLPFCWPVPAGVCAGTVVVSNIVRPRSLYQTNYRKKSPVVFSDGRALPLGSFSTSSAAPESAASGAAKAATARTAETTAAGATAGPGTSTAGP